MDLFPPISWLQSPDEKLCWPGRWSSDWSWEVQMELESLDRALVGDSAMSSLKHRPNTN